MLQLSASKLYNLGSQSISTCSAAYKHTITFYTMYTYMHIYAYTTIYTHQARIPYRVYIDRYKHKYMHTYIHTYIHSDSDYHHSCCRRVHQCGAYFGGRVRQTIAISAREFGWTAAVVSGWMPSH
jgi:hypothetical protein